MLLLISGSGFCLDVSVLVNKNSISENESVRLQVVVKGSDATVDTSAILDFKVFPRGTSTSVSIVNTEYSKSTTHTFSLVPQSKGTLTIPPLTVSRDGEVFLSKPIVIEVASLSAAQKQSRDVFAQASLSGTRLFTGQQAIYTFRLFSAVRFSNARLQEPSFKGFTAKEAGDRKTYSKVINGRPFDVTEINYVIVPEKSGDLVIDPAMVICEVPVQGSSDPFGDSLFGNRFFSMGRTKTERAQTDSFTVTVMPLPAYSGKSQFSGLVGKFSIGAGLDRAEVPGGESATLTVTISGTGNIMDAPAPAVNLPQEFKTYDDTPQETIELTPAGYTGEKVFKRALVPVKPGNFEIGPVMLTYFDTATGSYETVSTPPLTLKVTSAGPSDSQPLVVDKRPAAAVEAEKQAVEFTGHDILALKEGAGVLVSRTGIHLGLFCLLLVLPGIMFGALKAYLVLGRKDESTVDTLLRRSRSSLDAAAQENLPVELFLKHLYMALTARVMARAGRASESLTAEEAGTILTDTGCSPDSIREVASVLAQIDQARYSGGASNSQSSQELFTRVKIVLKTLGIGFLLALCVFQGTGGAAHADDSATVYLEAIKAYKEDHFKDAAEKFQQVINTGIVNGELCYNLGNALLKSGDTGRAILWYERAKKLIPLDPDLSFNLNYATRLLVDKPPDEGINILELVFFWKDYLASRTIEYGVLILGFCFFAYAGIRTVRRKRVFTLAGIVFFCVVCLGVATALVDYYQMHASSHAVIVAQSAPVRSGFSDQATELFVLHAGTKVRVEEISSGYIKIVFAPGKIGWIKSDNAEVI
ncbi:MAG: BatD family protein [Pseudomonadota bacterium]